MLNVIALFSGGKDSFFSLLHCRANGHRIVALANLHPPEQADNGPDEDLNSFMYQTVGHQVIPLYAAATHLPLYRHVIVGGAAQTCREYHEDTARAQIGHGTENHGCRQQEDDETESMIPLLRTILAAHPEANALCAGAILSTYQRTRVESVAVRLGLVPLAYLWKYPVLPFAQAHHSGRLLLDMAASGLDARIVKVASAGLDEAFLWEKVASAAGKQRLERAMGKFGAHREIGAVLGEGGEFETLVVDGPADLFRGRIVVGHEHREVVREGGGCAWLRIKGARVEAKKECEGASTVARPSLWDARSVRVLASLGETLERHVGPPEPRSQANPAPFLRPNQLQFSEATAGLVRWTVTAAQPRHSSDIVAEARCIVSRVRTLLRQHSLSPSAILTTTILLRSMDDFPAVNAAYVGLLEGVGPNPPSRLTVSCGDALARDPKINMVVAVTVHRALVHKAEWRRGLHVQSRSYWAPASIGPYSQAVWWPVVTRCEGAASGQAGPHLVAVAGQIPLEPASMDLWTHCSGEADGAAASVVLALQHLWRIGADVGVVWWSSAVAFFPSARFSAEPMQRRAQLAGRAWKAMYTDGLASLCRSSRETGDKGVGDDDDDDDEPDLWDRHFNRACRTMADAGPTTDGSHLPDWNVLADNGEHGRVRKVPPVFVAQVDQLPRAAPVEWHAHVGFSALEAKSVHCLELLTGPDGEGKDEESTRAWVTALRVSSHGGLIFVHVTAMVPYEQDNIAAAMDATVSSRLRQLCDSPSRPIRGPTSMRPVARYVDAGLLSRLGSASSAADDELNAAAISLTVPCLSLWDGQGARLAAVGCYEISVL